MPLIDTRGGGAGKPEGDDITACALVSRAAAGIGIALGSNSGVLVSSFSFLSALSSRSPASSASASISARSRAENASLATTETPAEPEGSAPSGLNRNISAQATRRNSSARCRPAAPNAANHGSSGPPYGTENGGDVSLDAFERPEVSKSGFANRYSRASASSPAAARVAASADRVTRSFASDIPTRGISNAESDPSSSTPEASASSRLLGAPSLL
mmetsp:Transcript_9249/g.38889  ORF Transcript_9249/g.38889 Transcript_9249/m.38889 type:complete len:216 (-) Transcript_9249:2943-3590(-)